MPHGREPAHTDTAMCWDGLTQRWEQLSERASVVVRENRQSTQDHVFGFILCVACHTHHQEPGTVGNPPVGGTVTSMLKCPDIALLRSRKIHHHYKKCQTCISSQIREQIGRTKAERKMHGKYF